MEKLVTANEIFDYVSNIGLGSVVLILDKTRFESLLFLNSLLSPSHTKTPVMIVSTNPTEIQFKVNRIELDKLPDINSVNHRIEELRKAAGSGTVVVHDYLPALLVRDGEDQVLQMIEFWLTRARESQTIEFLTLPQGTFPEFEKKVQALVHGTIVIELSRIEKQKRFSFIIFKACKPEYHMEEFPFVIKDDRLLIKWGTDYVHRLPSRAEERVRQRVGYLRDNVSSLRLSVSVNVPEKLSPNDYILLSSLDGMHLAEIKAIFPDIFDSLIEKIARWNLSGIVGLEEADKKRIAASRDKFRLRTRLALLLPDRLAARFLAGSSHRVPAEVYWGLKESIQSLCALYFPAEKQPMEALANLEELTYEVVGRRTAMRHIQQAGEDPHIVFDDKYLKKIVSLTLFHGFGIKPTRFIDKATGIEVILDDCFLCRGIKSEKAICGYIAGTLAGALSQAFKKRVTCVETQCKAFGAVACVFILKR